MCLNKAGKDGVRVCEGGVCFYRIHVHRVYTMQSTCVQVSSGKRQQQQQQQLQGVHFCYGFENTPLECCLSLPLSAAVSLTPYALLGSWRNIRSPHSPAF